MTMPSSDRPLSELERDVEASRTRLELAMNDLGRQMTLDGLFAQLRRSYSDELSRPVETLVEKAKNNPLPVGLIGAGLGWLLLGDGGPSTRTISRNARYGAERAMHSAERFADGVEHAAESALHRAEHLAGKAKHGVEGAAASARVGAERMAGGARSAMPHSGEPIGATGPHATGTQAVRHDIYGRPIATGREFDDHHESLTDKARGKLSSASGAVGERAHQMGERVSGTAHSVGERVSDRAHAVGDRVSDSAHAFGDAVSERAHALGHQASHFADDAREEWHYRRAQSAEMMHKAGDEIRHAYKSNPVVLALGVAALASLAGVLVPNSRRENEAMGPYAKEARYRAQEAVGDAMHQAEEVADKVLGDVEEAADEVVDKAEAYAHKAIDKGEAAANKAIGKTEAAIDNAAHKAEDKIATAGKKDDKSDKSPTGSTSSSKEQAKSGTDNNRKEKTGA